MLILHNRLFNWWFVSYHSKEYESARKFADLMANDNYQVHGLLVKLEKSSPGVRHARRRLFE